MLYNRKNTTKVVSSWRNFLNENITAAESDEILKGLQSELADCGWSDERINALKSLIQRCKPTKEELELISYGTDSFSSNELNNDEDLSSKIDDYEKDFSEDAEDYDSQEYYEDFPTGLDDLD